MNSLWMREKIQLKFTLHDVSFKFEKSSVLTVILLQSTRFIFRINLKLTACGPKNVTENDLIYDKHIKRESGILPTAGLFSKS